MFSKTFHILATSISANEEAETGNHVVHVYPLIRLKSNTFDNLGHHKERDKGYIFVTFTHIQIMQILLLLK